MENRGNTKTCISQFSLLSDYVRSRTKLQYEKKYTFFSQYERIYISPLTSGYANFSLVSTILPRYLHFDSQTGTIWGNSHRLTTLNVTIRGENMWDHTFSQASFIIETKGKK